MKNKMPNKDTYFVFYNFKNFQQTEFGNAEISLASEVTTFEHIKEKVQYK